MVNEKKHTFQNKIFSFESFSNHLTDKTFEEFNQELIKLDINSKIDGLIKGLKVNYTEDRGAWHAKYRASHSYSPTRDISKYLRGSIFEEIKNIAVIGIGGSYIGTKLLYESLVGDKNKWNTIFLTGSDLNEFHEKISNLNKKETIFIVASKSFKTDETISLMKKAISWSGDINKFIAITSIKSNAIEYGLKNIVEFDEEIGGRYSIWSDISIPAFINLNNEVDEFIHGGHQADLDLQDNEEYFNFVKTMSFTDIWNNNFNGINVRAILSYSWKLRSFPEYVQQLEMESLGKHPSNKSDFKKTGQIIFGGYGPKAQHSYFQLLYQGTQKLCADLIALKDDKNSLAYIQAISQSKLLSSGIREITHNNENIRINGNVPVNIFLINKINAFSLGYLIATWEHRTFLTAALLQINPFDQFGVNAGKILAKEFNKDN